jgi:ribosomal protein S18 acetylase RimI-like enzyme
LTSPLLDNPVYNALTTGDAAFANGDGQVKYFDEEVSPFAGFPENYKDGFNELHTMLPAGRKILFASRKQIAEPEGWKLLVEIEGLQFLFDPARAVDEPSVTPVPLDKSHADEMVALAALTKPGPFNSRTIEFGEYYGIFENGRLASMTGQRLHIENYTEVSAVCTHPDFLGRGYAAALLQHQLQIICRNGEIPFLHVRADNERAIALYERLGFKKNGGMNFYFLKRMG